MSGQAPMLQEMMSSYLEQSRALFEQMQRPGALFPGMPGFGPPAKK
jgi:hypothetical protein